MILPRLLLQVRGAGCEVVCGMRVKGFLEEKEEGPLERSGHSWFHARTLAPEEISGTSEEKISGSASSAVAETQDENYIDWSPWKLRAPAEADVDTTGGGHISPPAPKLGKGPRAVIDLQLEHGVVGAGLRPRKWWKEPTGAAERLLPKGVETLPQKLPLISQQRFWHPKTDRERGLKRAWRQLSAKPELPWTIDLAKAQANFDPFDELPKSARVKMLKNQDCYKLKDSRWLWRCMVEGGPKRADEAPRLEERFGSLPEHFDRLYQELQSTCFAEWVTLGPCTESQERPMKTGDYAGGGGALLPPPAVTGMTGGMMSPSQAEEGALAPNPLDASSPCERCHQRALAKVPLKGSMLAIIWDAEVCFVCLRCGWASTDATGQRAELLEGEKILEVATTFLLRPGDGDMLQRSVARVLRVESNCCSVAVAQDGLLRILSDLVQDPALQAKQAAEEFKDFVLTDNGGADVVLELMKGNLKNKTRVTAALYTLAGVVTLIPDAASTMATELGSKVLIQTVWKYWSCGDTRRRSLMLLRRMRDAKPDLTAFMLKHWKASLAAMECGQSEDPDAATPEGTPEPVVEATPEVAQEEAGDERDDRDGNAVGDEGIGAVEEAEGAPEDQLEQAEMPLESCEMSQLDEETLEAVQPEEGRGPQTRESVAASPEPEAAPGNKLMTEAQLPREMRHFLALLKVHRFEQKSHILAIPDVVKAIVDFKDDPELSRLGMRALMSGTAMEQEMRLPTIGRCPNFVKSVRRIMHKESMQEVLQLQLRLVLGILDNDPSDYQDWVECAVFATVKVLQATVVWTTNSWEVILQAIEEAICTPQGKILLQNFNVALSLYKEWEKLKDSHDDALAKMIVSSFHDQTERILEIIG